MNLGPLRRLLAVMMAVAILVAGAPMLPASAAMDCGDMAMDMTMPMAMDMKNPSSQKMPVKPVLPCNDGFNCLGGAGCAAPAFDYLSAASLPKIATLDANWASRLGRPGIAHKPALPPPIV